MALRQGGEISGFCPPCGARKTVRAYAIPPVFRPLRKRHQPFIRHWRRAGAFPLPGPTLIQTTKRGFRAPFGIPRRSGVRLSAPSIRRNTDPPPIWRGWCRCIPRSGDSPLRFGSRARDKIAARADFLPEAAWPDEWSGISTPAPHQRARATRLPPTKTPPVPP